MKKFILPLLISLAPILLKAQPLACDIQINGTSFVTYDLCVGEDVVLNGTPSGGTTPYSHLWAGGGSQLTPTNNNPTTFTATTPGSYTITYTLTDALSATCSDQIVINVNALPSLFTSQNDTICLGECTSITAVTFTGDALFWYPGFIGNPVGDTTTTGSPPLSLTINNICPANDTDYYAMAVISSTGCIRTKKVSITVINLQVTANGSPNPICLNDTSCLSTIITGGTSPYSYEWFPTTDMDDPFSASPCVWPSTNTTYCVTVTEGSIAACTAFDCFTVTVNPQVPPTITPPQDTICYGDCTTLTASGSGNIWEWDPNGELTAAITVCPTVTTVYTVTMTDATGCTASADATVTVSPQVIAEAGANDSICYGECTTIGGSPTASGGTSPYTYGWSPSGGLSSTTAANPQACPTVTTTYIVTVTDDAGCTETDDVTVTVNPQIIISIAPTPPSLCLGSGCSNLTTTVSGGTAPYTYQWSPCGSLNNCTAQSPIACPNVTTIYTLTVTDAIGCTQSATTTVTVNVPPTANAGIDQTVCSSQLPIIIGGSPTASGGTAPYLYNWSPSAGLSSSTVANPSANPASTTTYCVIITDAVGCTASDCITITVNPSPTAEAGPPVTVCQGICTPIGGAPTASGGTPPYTYQWNPAGSLSSSTVANPIACPLTTTTYFVTVTDVLGFGCTATDNVTVTVNTATATAVANPAAICAGACSDITATGGGTYQWSNPPGGTTATINVCPAVTTTYTVTVTATNGCTAVASATVTVTALNVTATPTTSPLCLPNCTDITANASGGTTYTYQWSNPPGGTTQTINVCPTATTTYTVTVTSNGCTQSASTTVTVYSVTASATPNPICSGQCTTVSATPNPSGGGITYQWNTGQTTASFIDCPASTTTYTVTVNNNGCTSTASVTVDVTAITAVAAPSPIPICLGDCAVITLTPNGGTPPYTYQWSPATGLSSTTVQNPTACPTTTTTYTVTITDANGCAGTATTTVTVVTVTVVGNPTSVCAGDSAMLVATGGGTYQWSVPPGGTNDTVFVTPVSTTTYTVTVTNAGCTASAQFTVTVGAFTVNATANPTNVCSGSGTPVTLGVSMGSSYSWVSSPNDPSLAGQTTLQNPVVTPTQTTTYTVTVTSSGGCTASASVTVTVDMLNATASAPAAVCSGDCVTIVINITGGTPPYTYAWCCGLGNGTSANPCPLVTTTYTCTITDFLGCTDEASFTVTALPLPPATVTPATQNICAGGTATITGSGGGTYSWSSSPPDPSLVSQETNSTINVSPTVTTTYTLTVTDANLCDSVVTATVNVTTAPVACFNPVNTNICSGDCVTITACGGSDYSWSSPPGGTANPITVCPAITTTYTVSVTQAGCTETSTASIMITVTPTPTISLSIAPPSITICAGTCVTFTATGVASSYDFVVNGASQQLSGNNTYTTCTLTNPSSVYVIASNGGPSCDDTSNVITITVNPTPNAIITASVPPSICGACDGSLTVSPAPPGYTYLWNDPSAQTTQTATGLCAGVYVVTVTSANSCSASTSGTLSDPGSPLTTLTSSDPNDSICDGDCITFTGGGTAVTFEFFVNGVSQGPPSGNNIFTICTLADGDQVAVEGTDAIGCTGLSNIISITVNSLPVQFSITGGLPFCTGGCSAIGLNGSEPGVNYYLFLNGVNHGPTVPGTGSPISFGCETDTGSFTVVAQTVSTACQNNMFGWVDVIENPLPTIFSITGGGSFCEGDTGVLIGLSGSQVLSDSISYQIIINGVTQDTTIIGNGGAISFGNWTIPGTYQIVATNIQTTCSDTMTGSVTVTSFVIPVQYTVTGGGSYCDGGIGVFIGLSGSDLNALYQIQYNGNPLGGWINGTGLAMNFGLFTAAGSYSVIAQNALSCLSIMFDTVIVVINPIPNANAGVDVTICQGSSTTLNGNGGITFSWTPAGTLDDASSQNPLATPASTTTYWLTVTDANGCTDNDDVVVNVLPFTYPAATAADSVFCSYETVNTILDAGPGYSGYQWSIPPGGNTQTITVTTAGCYTVTVTAANGCSAFSTICVLQNPPMPAAVILVDEPTQFCQPDSIELYLNNPYYTFEWSSGSINTSSIFVSETGSYYVTVTDSFGCRDTAGPMNIIVDPLPEAIISYVDQDNAAHTFDFYNNSLYSTSQSWDFGDGTPLNTSANPSHDYVITGPDTVILTVTNNCGTDYDTAYINIHEPTSGLTENSGIFDFDLYPNPTKDIINMDFSLGEAGTMYFIMYDALGQEMVFDESSYLSGEQHKELSLADLSKGVYVLKVSTDKGSFVRRIIKD